MANLVKRKIAELACTLIRLLEIPLLLFAIPVLAIATIKVALTKAADTLYNKWVRC